MIVENSDYRARSYLSVGEVAANTGIAVRTLHQMVRDGKLPAVKSAGGQYRFCWDEVRVLLPSVGEAVEAEDREAGREIEVDGTRQRLWVGDARGLSMIEDDSVHLAVTSPPYFNAKMYSDGLVGDLGNVHDFAVWLAAVEEVWREVWRVLRPGRKFFVNVMNLPVREGNSYRSVNLVGKTVDSCEAVGFVFKRDIVWHKTNGVRAHFGTYPYPGGILLNNMHESILEFQKPATAAQAAKKYAHVSAAQKAASRLDKDFWLSLKNSDVWVMTPEKSGGGRTHAAPFPVALPERLIRAYSFVGETVLDPFAGSGTTLAAAAMCGRDGVGVEVNAEFVAAAARRLAVLAGAGAGAGGVRG